MIALIRTLISRLEAVPLSVNGLICRFAVAGVELPGVKQVVYGALLFTIAAGVPHGIWPWLQRRLRPNKPAGG